MKMLRVIERQEQNGPVVGDVKCPWVSFARTWTEHSHPVLVHALPCLGAFSGGVFYGSLGTKDD